jgi:hypothetical protein
MYKIFKYALGFLVSLLVYNEHDLTFLFFILSFLTFTHMCMYALFGPPFLPSPLDLFLMSLQLPLCKLNVNHYAVSHPHL